jgi:hypothetical protein
MVSKIFIFSGRGIVAKSQSINGQHRYVSLVSISTSLPLMKLTL